MDKENTANTSGDNAKDLPAANPNQRLKGEENANYSTAAEGTLKTPDELPQNFGTGFEPGEENDLDDLVHSESTIADEDVETGGQTTPLNEENKFTPDDISS